MSRSSKENENRIGEEEEGSTTKEVNTRHNNNIREMLNESYTKVVSEMTKFQPQYLQSLSNLQLDYMEMVRNMRENLTFMENQMPYSNNNNKNNVNGTIPLLYAEQVAKKQLNDFTTNITRILTINNQLTLTAMDAARENLNICNKVMNALAEFNSNIIKTWNSFCTNIT